MYKIEPTQRYGYRKVSFKEADEYAEKKSFRLLQYMTLILRIFNLEYYMSRNSVNGKQVLDMENCTRTGMEFWSRIAQ